ncbi:glycoside hydrolase family 32 protein [Corynebacterium mastitidis]|uniref:glycoside hydrolase family 32 protein n=1 Tax=Corynebacterium mastitidis TaxID=161890 RepID=UPI0025512D2D|nr:glycoside hydrolase family 32 protein [Corynebacterium mastitidis]MDK8450645.1 glycoside hydrolase family 32 protein [Corynebacterium mastitidis]
MTSPHLRPAYHIAPRRGRLNDPNGVFLSDGALHVHYQYDPVFPDTPKRTGWGYARIPTGGERAWRPQEGRSVLEPVESYDRHGCYSGCAVPLPGGGVELFYTGNLKEGGRRLPSQNRVRLSGEPGSPESYRRDPANPLIDGPASGYTGHYRDPHITPHPEREGAWRMILGAQRADGTGTAVLYASGDLRSWDFGGELRCVVAPGAREGESPLTIPEGYMWECPNLLRMVDQEDGREYDVLVLCPQGLDEVEEMLPENPDVFLTHLADPDRCGYLVGHLRGTTLEVTRGFSELDYGHEFYAPQLIAAPGSTGGEAIMLAWMGMPGRDDTPTARDGWVHMLTVPRRVTLRGGRLYQEPLAPRGAAWTTRLGGRDARIALRDATGAEVVRLGYDAQAGALSVSRLGGTVRGLDRGDGNAADTRTFRAGPGELTVLLDGAAVEIYAADGAATASLQAYPDGGWARPEVMS